MDELIDAINIIKRYNKMPLKEFVSEVESYTGNKISEKDLTWWKYLGLSNKDFIKYFEIEKHE